MTGFGGPTPEGGADRSAAAGGPGPAGKTLFSLYAETPPGCQVLVVGSTPELGVWEPADGLRLKTSPDAYPRWTAAEVLQRSDPPGDVEYKFVILEPDVGAVWERGPNRRLRPEATTPPAEPAAPPGAGAHISAEPTTPRFGDLSHLAPAPAEAPAAAEESAAEAPAEAPAAAEQPAGPPGPPPPAGRRGLHARARSAPDLAALEEAAAAAAAAAAQACGAARAEDAAAAMVLQLPGRAGAKRVQAVFGAGGARALAWQPSEARWACSVSEAGLAPGLCEFHFLVDGEWALSESHAVFGESNFAIVSSPVRRCILRHDPQDDALEEPASFARACTSFEGSARPFGLARASSVGSKLASLADDGCGSDTSGERAETPPHCAWAREQRAGLPEEVFEGLCGPELRLRLHGVALPGPCAGERRPLRLWAGHERLKKDGPGRCEDACFWSGHALGISDGVGSMAQYAKFGVDSAEYASQLMRVAAAALMPGGVVDSFGNADPVARAYRAVEAAEAGAGAFGAATAAVLTLSSATRTVGAANLGDSGFMLLRRGPNGMAIERRSSEQHHGWNFPFQLTRLPPTLSRYLLQEDHCTDCDTYAWEVQEGDLLLVFSDGVRDNLHDAEILSIVDRTVPPVLADLAGLPEHATPPERVARALASAARLRSVDPAARVPFNIYSRRHGLERTGGKEDDITVVAAWVLPECGSTIPAFDAARALQLAPAGLPRVAGTWPDE